MSGLLLAEFGKWLEARRAEQHTDQDWEQLFRLLTDVHRDWLLEMPYSRYLETPEWRERRDVALEHANYRCQVCNASEPLDVHHRTYERRGHEHPSDLIALCRKCHQLFHDQRHLVRSE